MRLLFCLIAQLLMVQPVFAQGDFAPPPSKDDPLGIQRLKPLPAGVILIPGAVPSASDTRTSLPETGTIRKNVYDNAYFGITWAFPEQWGEEFKGPPPSDTGQYVLANLVGNRASILVTAQDLFFALTPPSKIALPSYYKMEAEPSDIQIAKAAFSRYSYMSPVAGLHWVVFATEIRCHLVQFVLSSQDTKLLEQVVENLKQIKLSAGADVPRCVADYARPENIVYKSDPVLADTKFNPIPVRIIIGKNGKVRHVHVISAFASQAQTVTDAMMQWRFKPSEAEIETGILFGSSITRRRAPTTSASSISE